MNLTLAVNDYLRLSEARGATVDVLEGRVWITEAGRTRDVFVASGMRYAVAGDGLVVVSREDGSAAQVAIRQPAWRLLWEGVLAWVKGYVAGVQARRTVCELERLSDHSLRDIGLTRDDIESAVRARAAL